MSVSLVVEYSDPEKNTRLIPIATERIFDEYWQPACKALGLKWIPLFQSGLPLPPEDIPDVLEELSRLETHLSSGSRPDIPADVREQILSRIGMLVREL
jgi:hypothetical protein